MTVLAWHSFLFCPSWMVKRKAHFTWSKKLIQFNKRKRLKGIASSSASCSIHHPESSRTQPNTQFGKESNNKLLKYIVLMEDLGVQQPVGLKRQFVKQVNCKDNQDLHFFTAKEWPVWRASACRVPNSLCSPLLMLTGCRGWTHGTLCISYLFREEGKDTLFL